MEGTSDGKQQHRRNPTPPPQVKETPDGAHHPSPPVSRSRTPDAGITVQRHATEGYTPAISMSVGIPATKTSDGTPVSYPTKAVEAVLDTGATGTLISRWCFERLQGADLNKLNKTDTTSRTATGEPISIYGYTTLDLVFTSTNGTKTRIPHKVHVAAINDPFLLGQDVLQKEALLTTNDAIYLRHPDHRDMEVTASNLPLKLLHRVTHKVQVKHVPVAPLPPAALTVCRTTFLPPGATEYTPCAVERSSAGRALRHVGVRISRHADRPPGLETLPVYAPVDEHRVVHIPLTNTTKDVLWLRPGHNIARATAVTTKDILIRRIGISEDTRKRFSQWTEEQQRVSLERRLDAKGVEKEMREDIRRDFFKSGRATLPIEGESRHDCPQHGLVDDTPKTDDQVLAEIKLDHLPPERKEATLGVLRNNLDVFARHDLHFKTTPLVESEIILKPVTQVAMQHFRPTPEKTKPAVLRILKQMQQYGIISECHEASPFLSQSFTVAKKGNKGIRLLLDGRSFNGYTQKLPVRLPTMDEVAAKLAGADWTSTLDVSNAYWAIRISPKHRKYTRFLSPDRQPLMYNCLAMGMTNSGYYY